MGEHKNRTKTRKTIDIKEERCRQIKIKKDK